MMTTTDAARTCAACPSYIPVGGRDGTSHRTLQVGACGKRRLVLTTLNMRDADIRATLRETAARCDLYGQEWDGAPPGGHLPLSFATPLARWADAGLTRKREEARPASCHGCRARIAPEAMARSFGIPALGCARWGTAIPGGAAAQVAQSCPEGEQDFEQVYQNVAALALNAELSRVAFVHVDGSVDVPADEPADDPLEIGTAAEVTAADREHGIRAWREVASRDDPSRTVLLPVFDPEFFDEAERAKIPRPGDDEHPELYADHQGLAYTLGVLWRHLGEVPALHGFAGSGKTMAYHYLAFLMQLPFERLSITASTELDELMGRHALVAGPEGNYTEFQYGRLPLAWAKPCVIVLDEPNTAPPEVWHAIRPLTDNAKQMVLDMNRGERIAKHPHAYFGMAMNPAWDIRNSGVHEIADADGSRLAHIAVPHPAEDVERQILIARCKVDGYDIDKKVLDAVMAAARELRELAADGDALSMSWGTRQTIKVARATRFFSLRAAHRLAAADLLDPAEAERVLAIVASHEPAPVRGRR